MRLPVHSATNAENPNESRAFYNSSMTFHRHRVPAARTGKLGLGGKKWTISSLIRTVIRKEFPMVCICCFELTHESAPHPNVRGLTFSQATAILVTMGVIPREQYIRHFFTKRSGDLALLHISFRSRLSDLMFCNKQQTKLSCLAFNDLRTKTVVHHFRIWYS